MSEGWFHEIAESFGGEVALEDADTKERIRFQELPDCLSSIHRSESSSPTRFQPRTTLADALRILAALRRNATPMLLSTRFPDPVAREIFSTLPPPPAGCGTIFFTSGSSGQPKAVLHDFSAHLANARGAATTIPLEPGDRWWIDLPLFHVSGFGALIRTLDAGATAVFSEVRKSGSAAPPHTHRSVVATQLRRMLENPNASAPTKALLGGGGPFPSQLVQLAIQKGFPLHLTYGMTETASQICTTKKLEHPPTPILCGKPLPNREVRISPCGSIDVRGPVLFRGYWKNHGALETALDPDGWFSTGDLGRWSSTGELEFLGRKDRMFVSGGENIFPERIEQAIAELPGVFRVVVVPISDPEFGARPVVFLDAKGHPGAWEERLRETLPALELPDKWFRWPENLPEEFKPSPKFFEGLLAQSSTPAYRLQEFS